MATASFSAWLADLRDLAEGRPAPSAKDTIASMENACKDCSDEELAGFSALLFPPSQQPNTAHQGPSSMSKNLQNTHGSTHSTQGAQNTQSGQGTGIIETLKRTLRGERMNDKEQRELRSEAVQVLSKDPGRVRGKLEKSPRGVREKVAALLTTFT
eukprot:6203288-Pleurochrysis_carterae.AAC.1